MPRAHSFSFRSALTGTLLALAVVYVVVLLAAFPSFNQLSGRTLSKSINSNLEDPTTKMALVKQRAVAAVVGGFVADAAAMGLHWIYDAEKLKSLVAAAPTEPEFHEPPACPFYEYKSGQFSPYGDEIFPLLKYVASRGSFDPAEFAMVSYEAAKNYPGRLNGVFRELVKKGDAGEKYPNLASENKDLQGATKVPILVARYLGDVDTLVAKTKEGTRVHQIGEEPEGAAVASALLLEQLVRGVAIEDAVKSLVTNQQIGSGTRDLVQEVLDAVHEKKFPDATAAIDKFGKHCGLPSSLMGALYVLLTTSGYTEAVRANILAGGDNCSRGILVGAFTAAAGVREGDSDGPIPAVWKQKTTHYNEVQQLAEKLVE